MSHPNISTSFGTLKGTAEPFVNIEQPGIPNAQEAVNLSQIYRMWQRAVDGISGGLFRPGGCPVGFEDNFIHIWLDFEVYPSSPTLDYTLEANIGEIKDFAIGSKPKSFDIIFPLSDIYNLDFYTENVDFNWQTLHYIKDSYITSRPEHRVINTSIVLDSVVFAVARVNCSALVHNYTLHILIEKSDNSITGLDPVVTARWLNSEGEYSFNQQNLTVPSCVQFALKMCDGEIGSIHCRKKHKPKIVYYSLCDGSVVDVVSQDPESWCTEMVPGKVSHSPLI